MRNRLTTSIRNGAGRQNAGKVTSNNLHRGQIEFLVTMTKTQGMEHGPGEPGIDWR